MHYYLSMNTKVIIVILSLLLSACGTQVVPQDVCFKASEYTGCNPEAYVFEGTEGDPLYICKSIANWKIEAATNSDVYDRIVKPIKSRCN